jgi:hypothetical protein
MKIIYEDEYGEIVYQSAQDVPSAQIPTVSDTVVIDDEDWRVKSRVFHVKENTVVVVITQNMIRSKDAASNDSGRLNEMNRAILGLSKRQDASEKKGRMLTEQISTVRKHINTTIRNEKKDQT